MKISHLANTRFTSILLFLFITLQISACSTGDSSTTNSANPVEPDTLGRISVDWIAPSAREDNTPISLSAIAGYNVYYGSEQGQYPNTVNIADGSADSYIIANLPTGTYYFVVTTYDTDGRESQYSPVVIKTI